MEIRFVLVICLLLCSCQYKEDVRRYQLLNLDFVDNKVYIRGISLADPLDTFQNEYEIVEKSLYHIDNPKNGPYRMRIFQDFKFFDTTMDYTDTFYIEINRKKGDYFDWGKIYWFKLDSRYAIIDSFKNNKCRGSYYCYFLSRI